MRRIVKSRLDEHMIDLYHRVDNLKKDISIIKNNHLKHMSCAIYKIENTIKDLKEKVRDLREFHSSLSQGKTTLKGLWLKIIREEVTDM